jgi:hypothetical protein
MLRPIFINNGLDYEDNSTDVCLLIEECYVKQILAHFEALHINNYKCNLKDKPPNIKFICITEQSIYDYLDSCNIKYYKYKIEDATIEVS